MSAYSDTWDTDDVEGPTDEELAAILDAAPDERPAGAKTPAVPTTAIPFEPGRFLGAVWGNPKRTAPPEVGIVDGIGPDDTPMGLLYKGRSNVLFGPPGSGKTRFALWAVADVLHRGGFAAYLDFENDENDIHEALLDMGVTAEEACRFYYWQADGPLSDLAGFQRARIDYFVAMFTEQPFDLVVIDGVGVSITMAGGNESSNTEAQQWEIATIRPLLALPSSPSILCIDHTGHQEPGGFKRAAARGASAKLGDARGHVMRFDVIEAFSRYKSGRFGLVTTKCRPGHFTVGQVAAEGWVTPKSESNPLLTITMVPSGTSSETEKAGNRTWYLEAISTFLEGADGPQSQTKIEQAVGKKATYCRSALEWLVLNGFVERTQKGQSKLHMSKAPYRADAEAKAEGRAPYARSPFEQPSKGDQPF